MTEAGAVKAYTGVGSRQTPATTMQLMRLLASTMERAGYTLRSGGADGADDAFEAGVGGHAKEIYLPWRGFNQREGGIVGPTLSQWGAALELASHHHPGWQRLSDPVRALMARNCFQVLGASLDRPSAAVVCWAPKPRIVDGKVVNVDGGTGLAVRLAHAYNIPCYHLGLPEHLRLINAFIDRNRKPVPVPKASA